MPSITKKETQKEAIMRVLGVSSEEADQILDDDKEVDRGKKMDWDMSDAEHRKAMKNANADEHKKPKEPVKRERKANPTKGGIIAGLATFLTENAAFNTQNVQIANPARTVTFQIGDNSFELTLIQKRKPKN